MIWWQVRGSLYDLDNDDLVAGMGVACLISVLEFCWKSGRMESKHTVKHRKVYKNILHVIFLFYVMLGSTTP